MNKCYTCSYPLYENEYYCESCIEKERVKNLKDGKYGLQYYTNKFETCLQDHGIYDTLSFIASLWIRKQLDFITRRVILFLKRTLT